MPKSKPPGKALGVPQIGVPVLSLGPTAAFYFERADVLADACAQAMAEGRIHVATELYERGVNAMYNAVWHHNLAQCVGPDFTVINLNPNTPDGIEDVPESKAG